MKFGTLIALVIVSGTVFFTGLRLSRSGSEVVVAALVSAPAKPSISVQAMNATPVVVKPLIGQVTTFDNEVFNYRVSYPTTWDKQKPSANVVVFQSADAATQVKIEAVGPLPADGLTPFVDRSLGRDIVISRQSLTIQGFPTERVLVFSDQVDGQVTTFYLDAGQCAYVISGMGEQQAIEQMARSFTVLELGAQ